MPPVFINHCMISAIISHLCLKIAAYIRSQSSIFEHQFCSWALVCFETCLCSARKKSALKLLYIALVMLLGQWPFLQDLYNIVPSTILVRQMRPLAKTTSKMQSQLNNLISVTGHNFRDDSFFCCFINRNSIGIGRRQKKTRPSSAFFKSNFLDWISWLLSTPSINFSSSKRFDLELDLIFKRNFNLAKLKTENGYF